jgi:cyclic-di-AMP phosphodiesterase PgpH
MSEPPPSPIVSADRQTRDRVLEAGVVFFGSLAMGGLLLLNRPWPPDWALLAGVSTMSLLATLFLRYHLRHVRLAVTARKAERVVAASSLLSVTGVQAVSLAVEAPGLVLTGSAALAPVAAGAMLVSALIGPSVSLVGLSLVALLLGFSGALPATTVAAAWVVGAVGAHAVNPMKQRSDLIRAVWVLMLASAVIAACLSLVNGLRPVSVAENVLWAALSGVGAVSVFWLGVALLERMCGVVSDWSLLELCSPEHPLLKELCLRAPGTHAHSLGVANLAEAAARRIGANAVQCRTMAYYHDVGKLVRPQYFVENQTGANVHDELSPTLSAQIVASHVKDGADLARQHRLPEVVLDGIREHHGKSLIRYFFTKAVESGAAGSESEAFFRYDGPKPRSRESGILMLADQVEAVARCTPTAEIAEAVARTVAQSRDDGQLEDCDLTLRELTEVEVAFVETLSALRHERVVYPDPKEETVAQASVGAERGR